VLILWLFCRFDGRTIRVNKASTSRIGGGSGGFNGRGEYAQDSGSGRGYCSGGYCSFPILDFVSSTDAFVAGGGGSYGGGSRTQGKLPSYVTIYPGFSVANVLQGYGGDSGGGGGWSGDSQEGYGAGGGVDIDAVTSGLEKLQVQNRD
jgi:hypothetical protein